MQHGVLALLLHAHLPYVRHPEHDDFLEERWLFHAITDSYLPLLAMVERLERDRIPARFALSLSPTLLAMLADPLLRARYQRFAEAQLDFALREHTDAGPHHPLAEALQHHCHTFTNTLATWNAWNGDLVKAFRWLIGSGFASPWTTAATHPFLPLWQNHPYILHAQIGAGIRSFTRHLGMPPVGFWLPECGYFPGIEPLLHDHRIQATLLETHGLLNATPAPPHGPYSPVLSEPGIGILARDPLCASAVWSRHQGYPGDPLYREYHHDLSAQKTVAQLGPLAVAGQFPSETGIKPYAVTGAEPKQSYQPALARQRATQHAQHFVAQRLHHLDTTLAHLPSPPVFTAPYDAELFGHWWHEGPLFLEHLFRTLHQTGPRLRPLSPEEALHTQPLQTVQPAASTWGEHGYHSVWVHPENEWSLPHLHQLARRVQTATLAAETSPTPLRHRAARQALRELLLAQASDWPFILKQKTATAYADQRLRDHLARGAYLCQAIERDTIDPQTLADLEALSPIFPETDLQPTILPEPVPPSPFPEPPNP